MSLAYFPDAPERIAQANTRQLILKEYAYFAMQVRELATFARLKATAAMLETGADQPKNYEKLEAGLDAWLQDIFWDRLKDLRQQFADEGGDESRLPWPLEG